MPASFTICASRWLPELHQAAEPDPYRRTGSEAMREFTRPSDLPWTKNSLAPERLWVDGQ